MANDREETRQPDNREKEAIKDLDIDETESEQVKGGRINSGDPCDGGEVTSRTR